MVRITCDVCGKARPQSDQIIGDGGWVLGFDLEVETQNSLQRSLRILDRWDDRRVLELGSVQFCCEACRDAYVQKARAA